MTEVWLALHRQNPQRYQEECRVQALVDLPTSKRSEMFPYLDTRLNVAYSLDECGSRDNDDGDAEAPDVLLRSDPHWQDPTKGFCVIQSPQCYDADYLDSDG